MIKVYVLYLITENCEMSLDRGEKVKANQCIAGPGLRDYDV